MGLQLDTWNLAYGFVFSTHLLLCLLDLSGTNTPLLDRTNRLANLPDLHNAETGTNRLSLFDKVARDSSSFKTDD